MSNTIQIKRSSTASSVPTAGQLAQGELAVNLVDKKLYTKDNTNAVVLLNPEFSINGLTTTTVATDDFLPFADTSDSGNPKKATVGSLIQGNSLTRATAVTASGTSVDFTGIPSWVKRITVMFSDVSTNGTSVVRVRIGTSSGIETTGYLGSNTFTSASAVVNENTTDGVSLRNGADASTNVRQGAICISNLNANIWTFTGSVALSNTPRSSHVAYSKELSDTLTQVRITTVNGTDTFNAGTINIIYEG